MKIQIAQKKMCVRNGHINEVDEFNDKRQVLQNNDIGLKIIIGKIPLQFETPYLQVDEHYFKPRKARSLKASDVSCNDTIHIRVI